MRFVFGAWVADSGLVGECHFMKNPDSRQQFLLRGRQLFGKHLMQNFNTGYKATCEAVHSGGMDSLLNRIFSSSDDGLKSGAAAALTAMYEGMRAFGATFSNADSAQHECLQLPPAAREALT